MPVETMMFFTAADRPQMWWPAFHENRPVWR
jgi:hypothetical protein